MCVCVYKHTNICTCLTAVILIYLNVIHKMIRGFMQILLQIILKDTLIEDGMKNRNGKKKKPSFTKKILFWVLLIFSHIYKDKNTYKQK